MNRFIVAAVFVLLAAGCASAPTDKTPQTESGRLNSCMLNEIYSRQENGTLATDEWTAALEVLNTCLHRLNLKKDRINNTQSLNIAASVIRSLKPSATSK